MRRRDFLATTTLTASSLALPQLTAQAKPLDTANETPLQLGLIGAGYQGRVLLNAARQIPNIHFRALCDIWKYARNFGQKYLARYGHDVTTYTDYREMLDKEPSLDAVLVATPDFAHAQQVTACLDKGLHVYCEPMLAHTLDASRTIVQAAERSGKLLQVGFQRRSNPRYQHVFHQLVQQAKLPGQLIAMQTQWAQEADDLRGWPRRFVIAGDELQRWGYHDMVQFRNWLWFPKCCGGPFCNYVAHQLDVCNWFLHAAPQAVLASGGNDYYTDRPHMDTVMSVFEYPCPNADSKSAVIRASCNLFTATSAGGMRQFERLMGTEGSVQVSVNPRWTRIGREPNARDWDQWVSRGLLVKPNVAAAHQSPDDAVDVHVSGELELFQLPPLQTEPNCTPHLSNFFAAIRGQAPLACPPKVAWPSHVAAFMGTEAARSRTPIKLTAEQYRV